jgi:NADPH:quinone reductase-like Zn-dependent oxidoreductase
LVLHEKSGTPCRGSGGPALGPIPRLLAVAVGGPRLKVLTARPDPAGLDVLAAMVADGRLVPEVERVGPLAGAAETLRLLDAGHACGKTVLTV